MLSHLFRQSPANLRPLKVGVLLDGLILKRGFVEVLEDIRASNFAVLDLAVVHRHAPDKPVPTSVLSKVWSRLANPKLRRSILYDLYSRRDQANRDSVFEEVSCEDVLMGVERLEVEPITKGFVHRFPKEAVEAINARDLDVLLRFGFNILRGDILGAARYGVWSFHHGDNEFYRGGPALFWELWEGNPLSGVILQRLTEELDAGVVLCKSVFATAGTTSLAENRRGPYRATTHFVIRKLNELHRNGSMVLEAVTPPGEYRGRRTLYRTPTNMEMLDWAGRRISKRISRSVQPKLTKHWKIGIRKGGPFLGQAAANGEPPDAAGFKWMDSPKGRFYADPFLVERDRRTWMFAEDYDYTTETGRIIVSEITSDGRGEAFRPCLELSHHLSFPFVFEHDGSMYLVPESSAAHEVVLYRATEFPFRWKREKVLLRGDYVDTVVWPNAGRWWLLTTIREPPGYAVHGVLFYADSPMGNWEMHPQSPLFNDVRFGRNGGAPIRVGDRMYRVSQDCSTEYGRAFRFNEIVELDQARYRERPVANVEPSFAPGMIGTHTYTRAGQWEAIDGLFLERRRRIY